MELQEIIDARNSQATENELKLNVGDVVAIRGDLRINMDGRCAYTPDQLIDKKYLKHTGHKGIWLGAVLEVKDDMAKVGSGWRHKSCYEVMRRSNNE